MKTVTPQVGTHLRVSSTFDGQERKKSFHKLEVTIGRANGVAKPDLDLSPDVNVSRRHARLWMEDGNCWIEDLGSKFGTLVDGEMVYPGLKASVKEQSVVQIGDTTLRIECGEGEGELSAQTQFGIPPVFEVTDSLDARLRGFDLAKTASTEVMARQALMMELPMEFSAPERVNDLAQIIVKRVVETIPGAKRGTLLLRRAETDALAIAAFVSEDAPFVSEALARRTITEQKGFIWRVGVEGQPQTNGLRQRTESGMYAPLFAHGRALGVICVDNPYRDCAFSDDDLRLLLAIAHHAAISLVNRQLQDELRDNSTAMERLLANFSPKLRARLLEQARQGHLRPGGEKSEVTILQADIRSRPATGSNREAALVFEMFNRCYPALTEAIFNHDGSIQRCGSDSILAVFGAPEANPGQHESAVRAALAMQKAVRDINGHGMCSGLVCELGIGLHYGPVIHGFAGSTDRLAFTVVGAVIQTASRLSCGAASGEVLVSDELYERLATVAQGERVLPSTRPESGVGGYLIKGLTR